MKKILFMPDTHAPYHNDRAVELVREVILGWEPDILVVEGDWVDKYLHRAEAKRWPLGFGIGRMESNGVVHVTPVPIVNYKACVEGELYVG